MVSNVDYEDVTVHQMTYSDRILFYIFAAHSFDMLKVIYSSKKFICIVQICSLVQWFSTFLHQRTDKKRKNFLRTGSIQSQMNATDYRNHFVNQSCFILDARHYFGKRAKFETIY